MDVNDVRSLLTVVSYLKKETERIISNMYINYISINMVTLGTNGVLLVLLSRFEELRERGREGERGRESMFYLFGG